MKLFDNASAIDEDAVSSGSAILLNKHLSSIFQDSDTQIKPIKELIGAQDNIEFSWKPNVDLYVNTEICDKRKYSPYTTLPILSGTTRLFSLSRKILWVS